MEIVTPVIVADGNWTGRIDRFFSILQKNFDFRRDTTCGFHVHASFSHGSYTLQQLRNMAKAVAFWEPATARCALPSRQDRIRGFCKSNLERTGSIFQRLTDSGPLRGLVPVVTQIDNLGRDEVVSCICPDKYRAWNFLPSRIGGHGSIEFRRPPGVVNAKKAKYWIAFTMTFLDMAVQFNPESFAETVGRTERVRDIRHPVFEDQFLECARRLNTYEILDPRLRQLDEPRSLYISNMTEKKLGLLQDLDPDYGCLG